MVASLNGIIYTASRQVFALARGGLLPKALAKVSTKTHVPNRALIFCFAVGVISLLSGKTSELITLSVLGAVFMYMMSMFSLFALRIKQPNLNRPFKVPLYPYFPALALTLSFICFTAIVYYNLGISLIFVAGLILGALFIVVKNFRVRRTQT